MKTLLPSRMSKASTPLRSETLPLLDDPPLLGLCRSALMLLCGTVAGPLIRPQEVVLSLKHVLLHE